MEVGASGTSTAWMNTTESVSMDTDLLANEEDIALSHTRVDAVSIAGFTYCAPVLIFFGIIGNTLCLIVLQSKYFRHAPSSLALSAMAVTDSGVLLCGLMRQWIRAMTNYEIDIRVLSQGTCWFHYFFTYFLKDLSSWSLALLTIERMVSVRWPFEAEEWISKRRIALAWLSIAVALAVLNSHWFKTVEMTYFEIPNGTKYYFCSFGSDKFDQYFHKVVWPWLDLVSSAIAPMIIMLTCNVVMITTLVKARQQRHGVMRVSREADVSRSITAMLIGITIGYFLTTVPLLIYLIGVQHWPQATYDHKYRTFSAFAVLTLNYYLGNSTNFLVYCISGSKFRRALVDVLCCSKQTKRSAPRSGVFELLGPASKSNAPNRASRYSTRSISY